MVPVHLFLILDTPHLDNEKISQNWVYLVVFGFILYSAFNKRHYHKAVLKKPRCWFRPLMSHPEVTDDMRGLKPCNEPDSTGNTSSVWCRRTRLEIMTVHRLRRVKTNVCVYVWWNDIQFEHIANKSPGMSTGQTYPSYSVGNFNFTSIMLWVRMSSTV